MGRGKDTVKGVKFFYEIGALLKNPARMANPYAKRAKASAIALARKQEIETGRKKEKRATFMKVAERVQTSNTVPR
jgi:hypothetical protein